MRPHLIASVAISLTLLISGCAPQEGEEYFPPERDGDHQEYSLEYLAPFAGLQKGRMATRIDGTETINGKEYFKQVQVISGIPGFPPSFTYIRRDKKGIHAIDGDDNTKTEYTEIPFPLKAGSSWTARTPDGDRHSKAEGIETLQLFDRKYERCLKVSYREKNVEGYSYYCPGVGEIKGVMKVSGVTMEYVLDKR